MRVPLILLIVVACSGEPAGPATWDPPAYTRTFCLARIQIDDHLPGAHYIVSEPDSLQGDCAEWIFGSAKDTLLGTGRGELRATNLVAVWGHRYDSTTTPPHQVDGWIALIHPGTDDFSFSRDTAQRLQFGGVQEGRATNWWPFVGWWLNPKLFRTNATYWHGDSLMTYVHWCYNTDCTDHFFIDATWRRRPAPNGSPLY
ncbi:MAG TPA: hypothetical protein VG454_04180 [Gemmatimonadales bacterium]|nr:hypothetical protein [Gemmatimonadales bacterium]